MNPKDLEIIVAHSFNEVKLLRLHGQGREAKHEYWFVTTSQGLELAQNDAVSTNNGIFLSV